jgi:hypothetical protein
MDAAPLQHGQRRELTRRRHVEADEVTDHADQL